jgi:hypothetical protein
MAAPSSAFEITTAMMWTLRFNVQDAAIPHSGEHRSP